MPDSVRDQMVTGLGLEKPEGGLIAYAAPPAGQALLRGRLQDSSFVESAAQALGLALPTDPMTASQLDGRVIFRLGPDQWLAVDEADANFGQKLENNDTFAAIDTSSARSRIFIRGSTARDLLAVGAKIDLREKNFPAGAFAQTSVGNANVVVHASGNDAFDIYIARSFARSWTLWLKEAGKEFGLILARSDK